MLTLKGTVGKPAKEEVTKAAKTEGKFGFVQKVIGKDTYMVMAQAQIELEDEFSSLYYTASNQSNIFLMPPFEPNVLMNFAECNNTLSQCIEAMEVNIDGTGHEFVAASDDVEADEEEVRRATNFFNEPCPNESFVKIRRKLRRQIEAVGYSYLEVLRNMAGEIVGLRNIETHHIRLVKLDTPILVKKKLMRGDEEIELTMWVRERRFAQRVALKQLVYYKEFGATRNVDRNTGHWDEEGTLDPKEWGTELLMFGVHPDIMTPYYLPRWINQMPSVVGSRKAEEQNLQFLDSGGMPPAIIFIQGGTLAKDSSDQLRMYLSGKNKDKYRAVVIEAQSSSGSLEAAGNVQVKVERFGAERAQDAMFMKYDANTEEHVRVGFRLPPLFLGKPADYNFASAVTSYMVAEAQVFEPERKGFDELLNMTIMKELGFKTIKLKSRVIALKDVANQMKGLELVKDMATRGSFLDEVKGMTGMDLTLAALPQPDSVSQTIAAPGADGTPGGTTSASTVPEGAQTVSQTPHEDLPASTKPPSIMAKTTSTTVAPGAANPFAKGDSKDNSKAVTPGTPPKSPKKAMELIELAHEYAGMKGLVQKREMSTERVLLLKEEVANLLPQDAAAFNAILAQYAFGSDDPDLAYMVGCTHGC